VNPVGRPDSDPTGVAKAGKVGYLVTDSGANTLVRAKSGHVHGQTDDLGFRIASDPVHVHDLQATILHLLGLDHKRLTYHYQGRDFRLTDVAGEVVKGILA